MRFLLTPLILATFSLSLCAQDIGAAQQSARSLCEATRNERLPARDIPTASQKKAIGDCDAMAFYDAASDSQSARDWKMARICAVKNNNRPVLAMLYANGTGVKRDIALAIHFTCGSAGTVLEEADLIADLVKRREEDADPSDLFDICSQYASGYSFAYCGIRFERLEAAAHDMTTGRIRQSFSPSQLAAFRTLYAHMVIFAENRMEREVGILFSNQVSKQVEARRSEKSNFVEVLVALESGTAFPQEEPGPQEQPQAAIDALYETLLSTEADSRDGNDVLADTLLSRSGFIESHRSWQDYYAAWLSFARQRYTAPVVARLEKYLSARRFGQIRTISEHG